MNINTRLDTNPESKTFGQRLIYEDDTYVGTADEYFRSDHDEDDFDIVFEDVLPAAPPPPPPTPRLDAAAARHIKRHRVISTQQLLDMPEPQWFIERLIPHSDRLVIHGEPGSKKTFLALDLAVCAEHGIPWHGKDIAKGKVFYILGEGVTFLGKRLRALATGKNIQPEDIAVTWMAEPLNLFRATPEECELWAAFVRHFGFKYLVIDTLHMNTAGMDENSSQDMGTALKNATKIAGGTGSGTMLIFVHHNTKTGGMRGSSSLEGDCDTILEVKQTGPLTSKLKSDKIRDAEGFDDMELTFAEDPNSDSIYLATVGAATPTITNADRILNVLRAEPFTHTKTAVGCILGTTSGAFDKTWKRMVEDGWIISEVRPTTANRGPKMVDVWAVDEDEVPFMPGAAD